MNDEPDRLAQRARAAFDTACDGIDPAAANRLRLARRAALAGPAPRRWLLAPLAGAIALGLAALWAWPRSPAPVGAPIAVEPVAPATPRDHEAAEVPAPVAPPEATTTDVPELAVVIDEPEEEAPPSETALGDEELDWEALDDEDADLYAWLADAPVASDGEADAL